MDAFMALMALLVLGFILFGFIAYIKALVDAAKTDKWVWFVLMLLFWPLFIFYYMGPYGSPSSNK